MSDERIELIHRLVAVSDDHPIGGPRLPIPGSCATPDHLASNVSGASLSIESSGELVAIDLRDALDALSEITGAESTPEDVLDRIFQTFCIGK